MVERITEDNLLAKVFCEIRPWYNENSRRHADAESPPVKATAEFRQVILGRQRAAMSVFEPVGSASETGCTAPVPAPASRRTANGCFAAITLTGERFHTTCWTPRRAGPTTQIVTEPRPLRPTSLNVHVIPRCARVMPFRRARHGGLGGDTSGWAVVVSVVLHLTWTRMSMYTGFGRLRNTPARRRDWWSPFVPLPVLFFFTPCCIHRNCPCVQDH